MTAQPDQFGIVSAAQDRRERYARFAYRAPIMPSKVHRITVVCARPYERTIETVDVLPVFAPTGSITLPSAPGTMVRRSKEGQRRPYPMMDKADRKTAREMAARFIKVLSKVTNLSPYALTNTDTRTFEVTRARWLFFALMQVAHPNISYNELARPLNCDHSIPARGLRFFVEGRGESPFTTWLEHPLLLPLAPRLRAFQVTQ